MVKTAQLILEGITFGALLMCVAGCVFEPPPSGPPPAAAYGPCCYAYYDYPPYYYGPAYGGYYGPEFSFGFSEHEGGGHWGGRHWR